MGLCQSEEEKTQTKASKDIDRQISNDKSNSAKTVKLLLLGAGECGKSTVLKQMRILHNNGFSTEELATQRNVVFNNTISAMVNILKAMHACSVIFADSERENDARVINDVVKQGLESNEFTPEVRTALKRLWHDPNIQKMYEEKRLICHFHESTKFFLDSLDRISAKDYIPTEQDVLLTRIKTTGIVEVNFEIKRAHFRVFDVGGQRSERKKWIHCFEDVNALIFIVAISEYDEVLQEDEQTNRLLESLRLFESIVNSRWFTNTSVILFLNKKDLFEDKIAIRPITSAFPEYNGPQEYRDSVNYILSRFTATVIPNGNNVRKQVYPHETCATDTDQVQKILDSVISMIIQSNLHKTGLY